MDMNNNYFSISFCINKISEHILPSNTISNIQIEFVLNILDKHLRDISQNSQEKKLIDRTISIMILSTYDRLLNALTLEEITERYKLSSIEYCNEIINLTVSTCRFSVIVLRKKVKKFASNQLDFYPGANQESESIVSFMENLSHLPPFFFSFDENLTKNP